MPSVQGVEKATRIVMRVPLNGYHEPARVNCYDEDFVGVWWWSFWEKVFGAIGSFLKC